MSARKPITDDGAALSDGVYTCRKDMAHELCEAFESVVAYHEEAGHGPDGFEILEFMSGKIAGEIRARSFGEWVGRRDKVAR